MTGWLSLTEVQRRISLDQAAAASGISTKALEKDWWVTLTLMALFQNPYSKFLIFKGGTSLSKCWKLIERFSEDIDIALDPEVLGLSYEEDPGRGYLGRLKRKGCAFTSNELKSALENQFQLMGVPAGMIKLEAAEVPETMPDTDPQSLFVKYPSLYEPNPYLADEVKVEVGVRSKMEPFTSMTVQSLLHEYFPNPAYAETPFAVQVVEPHKTFLEKAFLLHEEFKKPSIEKVRAERMSRHLYDLEKMMDTDAGTSALKDSPLYRSLILHRKRYSRLKGMDYETLHYKHINFIPPSGILEAYEKDYAVMQEQMIYGESISFKDLHARLTTLLQRFRALG